MTSLDIGWTEAEAQVALSRFRRLFAFNLILQSLVALLCIVAPQSGASLTGIHAADAVPLLPVWGGMVLAVSALQLLPWLDPIRLRFQVGIAIAIRVLMVLIFLSLGLEFWRFAAFDAIFAVALAVLFHRALIAELQTRP